MTYRTQITGEILTGPAKAPLGTHADSQSGDDLARYFGALEDLGLECPSDEAVRWWRHAAALRDAAHKLQTEGEPGPLDLARQLSRGEVSIKQAEKEFPKVLASSTSDYKRAKLRLFNEARHVAAKACREALRMAGDDLLDGPRSVAMEALENPRDVASQGGFDAAQGMASLLRREAVVPRAEGAKGDEYAWARPDLVAEWREESGRAPTLQEMAQHPEWGPGIYSAAQVVEAWKQNASEPAEQETPDAA